MSNFPAVFLQKQNNMDAERLQFLLEKNSLTKDEKAEIKTEADKLGIKYNIKQGCRSCYDKLLEAIYDKLQPVIANVSLDGYRLKDPKHSFINCHRLFSNETIKEMEIGKIHPVVIENYFVKVEQPESEEPETDGTDS